MAPTVILIRHAQAQHNVAKDYSIHDPPLTDLGFGFQCDELAEHLQNKLPLAREIELIVASPMHRTLQTAQQSLGWLMQQGVPVALRPEWQENSAKPCDTGSPIADMQKAWPQFDWSAVDPVYPAKTGLYEFSRDGLMQRGIEAKRWLKQRPEKVVAVVSHAGFLRVGVSSKKFDNADYRIFNFAEGVDDDTTLVEWDSTDSNGGGMGRSPKGIFPMTPNDYNNVWPVPENASIDTGEAAPEVPA
ncbi:phosphoglycerate mutase [Phlyctema vagabunda]|uniref:Phosphoglycerate mutase n=1 Tax=Phlyctema vagabunda TaxID=108571 RepID=A0ABR4PKI3_9HELO